VLEEQAEEVVCEVRNNKRYLYSARVFLTAPSLPTEEGILRDLSLGGCRVQLGHAIDVLVGSEIEVNLQSNYLAFRTLGGVRHMTERGRGVGVLFGPINARGLRDLRSLIDDLESSPMRAI
jgi:hypothetical protein